MLFEFVFVFVVEEMDVCDDLSFVCIVGVVGDIV